MIILNPRQRPPSLIKCYNISWNGGIKMAGLEEKINLPPYSPDNVG
jgi:hypothetical protein